MTCRETGALTEPRSSTKASTGSSSLGARGALVSSAVGSVPCCTKESSDSLLPLIAAVDCAVGVTA